MCKPPSDDRPRTPRSRRSNRPPRSQSRATARPSWLAQIRNVVLVAAAKVIAKHGAGIVHGPDSILIYRLIAYFLITVVGGLVRLVLGLPKPLAPPAPARRPRVARTEKGSSKKKKKPNDTR